MVKCEHCDNLIERKGPCLCPECGYVMHETSDFEEIPYEEFMKEEKASKSKKKNEELNNGN